MANKYFFEKKATGGLYLWSDDDSGGGANSNWSSTASPTYTATTKPADTDTVVITASTTCTFDSDLSGFATGITLTVNGTLQASTTAGAYYLKLQNTDMTIAATGTLRAGTDTGTPYPSTCTFTIDHNNNAKSIEVAAGGHIYLYCTQPTNTYVTATAQALLGATEVKTNPDVSADQPWTIAGAQVRVVDLSSTVDTEICTIASLDADPSVHLNAGTPLAAQKEVGALVCLVTRNIRIINVAASDYAITYANSSTAGIGDYIGAEFNNCYRCINYGHDFTFAGTVNLLTTSPRILQTCYGVTFSGTVAGPGGANSPVVMSNCESCTLSGVAAGWTRFAQDGFGNTISGLCVSATSGLYMEQGVTVTSTGQIKYCSIGIQQTSGACVYGTVSNCSSAITNGTSLLLAGTLQSNSTADLNAIGSGKAYNALLASGTEFASYNTTKRTPSDYFESFDHNQTVNAFKAWCKGGIVSSATTDLPTGYTIRYDHEVESATYPCFRQYLTTVPAGQTVEVDATIRNTDGIDISAAAVKPRLQIIDVFADPLVDSTQVALDEDSSGTWDGTNTDWQNVSCIWANQGAAPRQVYVRLLTYSHDASTHTIDEAWAVATYQDQIADIWNKLPTNYIMGSSDQTDQDTLLDTLNTGIEALQGASCGKKVISADGRTVQVYDKAGSLFATLTRSGSGPYTWNVTWA